MTDWLGTAGEVLADTAKGAAAGSIVPGFGTVAGGLVGLATSLAGHAFGDGAKPALAQAAAVITGVADEAGQVAALGADPARAEAFRLQALQIAADREAARDQAMNDRFAAALADVADARRQTITLASAGSRIAWGAPVVSVLVMLAFAATAFLVLWRGVPTGAEAVASVMLGYVGGMATAVVSYWVGSSAGSAEKTRLLAASKAET